MSDPNNDGGAVYPYCNNSEKEYYWINKGMTLRDYFAGQWLLGFMSHSQGSRLNYEDTAHKAYCVADAMIAARKEGRP